MNEKTTWYLIRAGGLVAWGLLAAAIIFGLLLSARLLNARKAAPWALSVHRFLGGLSVLFTAIHLVALHMDDFVDFGVLDFVIPFRDTWRPSAVAWGVIAFWLMLAVEGSSLAMKHLPRRMWRMVHFLSAPLFVTATVHGFLAGSDAGRAFMGVVMAVVFFLTALTFVRIFNRRAASKRRTERTSSTTATPAVSAEAPSAPTSLAEALPTVDVPVIQNEHRNSQLAAPPLRGSASLPTSLTVVETASRR